MGSIGIEEVYRYSPHDLIFYLILFICVVLFFIFRTTKK
jgi:hypothetical protein